MDLNQKLDASGEIESTHQYMKIANSVFNERKHKSKVKIIQLKKQSSVFINYKITTKNLN